MLTNAAENFIPYVTVTTGSPLAYNMAIAITDPSMHNSNFCLDFFAI